MHHKGTDGQAIVEFALLFPVLLLLVLGVADFARLYTNIIAVQAGAREAADFGAFDASNWTAGNEGLTVAEMERRACTATSALPAYREPAGTVDHETCTNPTFSSELIVPSGVTDCSDPANSTPCSVHVTLHYVFPLFVATPLLPSSLTIDRDAQFAISDFPSS